MYWRFTSDRMIQNVHWSAWTRRRSNSLRKRVCQFRRSQGTLRGTTTANLFMMFAPLEGWRHVEVTDRHTAVD